MPARPSDSEEVQEARSASLRETEIHPSVEDPFKDDLLDRRELVESVAGALASFRQSHVVAINGGYGTGKTTALRFLEVLLRGHGFRVAVLNAWEQDHRHPLESLLYATGRAFGDDALRSGLKKAAKAVLPDLVAELGPPGTRSLGEQFLRRLMPDSSPLEEFRRRLEDAVEGDAGPVVFLIDELDRCRPDSAVGLLEWSKHAFSIDGIHFVFGVHLDQLSRTVENLYGSGFDGRGYLDRLIHMEVRLPPASVRRLVEREIIERQVGALLARLDPTSHSHLDTERLRDYLVGASLDARSAIRAVALFDATLRMLPENGRRRPFVFALTMMTVLKAAAPASFTRFVSGEATDLDVVRDLKGTGFLEGPRDAERLAWFQAFLIQWHLEMRSSPGSELEEVVPTPLFLNVQRKVDEGDDREHAARVLSHLSSLSEQASRRGLGTLFALKRIEWLAPF